MVRFYLADLEVFFPYDFVYPEQYEYMKHLKATLDAKGHCVLEMPTGTGKTVALLSLITSYQLQNPEIGKLIYCTRTVPEMEKALEELKAVVDYQMKALETDARVEMGMHDNDRKLEKDQSMSDSRLSKSRRILGMGMTARRNLCIHPEVSQEADRDKIDEKCTQLTAPWIRRKRLMDNISRKSQQETLDQEILPIPPSRSCGSAASAPKDIEDVIMGEISCNQCPDASTNIVSSSIQPNSSVCEFYENYESLWSPSHLPSGVYTINDMKRFGAAWKHPLFPGRLAPFCPYFGSRRMLQIANVVVLNYQYILDPKVSQAAFMGGMSPAGVPMNVGPSSKRGLTGIGIASSRDPCVVVFDEAHNIDNVCIEAFSINLNMMSLEKARQNVAKLEKEVSKAKAINESRLLEEYDRLVQNLHHVGHLDDLTVETLACPVLSEDIVKEAVPGTIRRAEYFLSTMKRLVMFLTAYIRVFTVKTEGPLTFLKHVKDDIMVDPKTLKFCYERLKSLLNTLEVSSLDEFTSLTLVANFFTLLGTYWEGFIIITDPYPEAEGIYDPLIQLSCLDSSLAMRPVLQKFQSVILTSGTISPLFLYPKLLGFQPVITASLPMSLDRNCICPLIVAKGADQVCRRTGAQIMPACVPLSSRFDLRSDQAVLRNFGSLLIDLAKTVPDGMVCFFTSYAFMELIVAEWYHLGVLAEVMRHKLVLMETKDVVATTLALHSFRRACDSGRGAVFFSVARGKVAEGIDFDRHYGRAVVLFGVPYQYTLSRILKARLDYMRCTPAAYIQEHYQVPENEFLTFDAMRQAAQCVGRVIRSKTDYGLMIFADNRYSRIDKRSKLPEWILRHLNPAHMALSSDVALTIARKFLMDMSQPLQLTNKSRLDLASLQLLERKQREEATLFGQQVREEEIDEVVKAATEDTETRITASNTNEGFTGTVEISVND